MSLKHSKTVLRISDWHAKARDYLESDPAVALMHSRRTVEAICKLIFCDKISPNIPNGLDELLQVLSKRDHIPKHVMLQLRSIQNQGNFGAHDQGDGNDEISKAFVEPCIKSLDWLYNWLLKDYLGGEYQTKPLIKEPAKESKKDALKKEPPMTTLDAANLRLQLPAADIEKLKNYAKYMRRRPRDIVSMLIRNHCKLP